MVDAAEERLPYFSFRLNSSKVTFEGIDYVVDLARSGNDSFGVTITNWNHGEGPEDYFGKNYKKFLLAVKNKLQDAIDIK